MDGKKLKTIGMLTLGAGGADKEGLYEVPVELVEELTKVVLEYHPEIADKYLKLPPGDELTAQMSVPNGRSITYAHFRDGTMRVSKMLFIDILNRMTVDEWSGSL